MKDIISLIAGLALLLVVLFMIHDARAVTNTTMEKINRVQQLYDLGIQKYDDGHTKHGCYLIRQAEREAWMIQGDNKLTYNQIAPIYKELCKR